jgi:glycosyltransferase involved in cell wall biosynthesis
VRIVHLVSDGEVAGGQVVALELARAARERGDHVAFVVPADGAFVDLLREERFAAHVLPLEGALDARSVLRLRGVLRAGRSELVHTHTHFSLGVLGRVAGRLAGARVIAHMHTENVFRKRRAGRAAQVMLDNATARLCSQIVAVSEATRDALVGQGYPEPVVVHNGVGQAGRPEPIRPNGVPTGVPFLLHIGRLAPGKGQRELIEALARLERRESVVVFVGRDLERRGAFARELEQAAESLGVRDRVVFAGFRDDVPGLLAAADVFVLPSWIEGLPMVVLEAMAHGTPVVTTPVGGTPELVVHGETGLLVPPRDPAALAAALDELLAKPELARRLGEAGRRRVEADFSVRTMTERVLAIYDEVAAR